MSDPSPPAALTATGLQKSYGPVVANRDISLMARAGTIHAVVGENGAGKSTLMRMLQGVERPDAGDIFVDGARVDFSSPADALSLGIGMVHQEFMIAPDLTLLENLVLGDEPVARGWGPLARIDWDMARAEGQRLADQIGASIDWDQRAASAPVHILQFVEIIRLLRRGCRTLILDEPTAVLAPAQVEELFHLLRRLRDQGATLLFISHKIGEVTALADEVTVIRKGATVFSNAVVDTSADEIASHIVNGAVHLAAERESASVGGPVLTVSGMSAASINRSRPLHDVSFDIRSGEVLGVAGVSGNGQGELVECVAGLRQISAGRIVLDGTDISSLPPNDRRRQGLGYISADRRHEGLSTAAGIDTNVVAGSHRAQPVTRRGWLNRSKLRAEALKRLSDLDVKFGRLSDPASSLSGGNQQKLVFAREIATHPRLLIASQPTRGVDLNGIAAIHKLLRDFRDNGGAVLLVSEELDELVSLSTRVIVLSDGVLVGRVDDPRRDVARIGNLMVQGAAA